MRPGWGAAAWDRNLCVQCVRAAPSKSAGHDGTFIQQHKASDYAAEKMQQCPDNVGIVCLCNFFTGLTLYHTERVKTQPNSTFVEELCN